MKTRILLSILLLAAGTAGGTALADSHKRCGGRHGDEHGRKGIVEGMFRHVDRNGDGRVDEAELLHVARQRFERMDRDGDQRLSGDEFKSRRRHLNMEIQRFRSTADENGDGTLSREEVLTGMRKRLQEMDADQDGFLTRREIHDYRRVQRFRELDRDGDGVLSEAEFLAERRPGRHRGS